MVFFPYLTVFPWGGSRSNFSVIFALGPRPEIASLAYGKPIPSANCELKHWSGVANAWCTQFKTPVDLRGDSRGRFRGHLRGYFRGKFWKG